MDTTSGDESRNILMYGVAIAILLLSLQPFGLFNLVSTVVGRVYLTYLSRMSRDDSTKDATVSHIFVYPGRSISDESDQRNEEAPLSHFFLFFPDSQIAEGSLIKRGNTRLQWISGRSTIHVSNATPPTSPWILWSR